MLSPTNHVHQSSGNWREDLSWLEVSAITVWTVVATPFTTKHAVYPPSLGASHELRPHPLYDKKYCLLRFLKLNLTGAGQMCEVVKDSKSIVVVQLMRVTGEDKSGCETATVLYLR